MARCWSCGEELPKGLHWKYWTTCPTCTQVEETKKIRKRLESSGDKSLSAAVEILRPELGAVAGALEAGFGEISGQLSNIASILEWGFEEINWRLDQVSETLKSIEKTLKSPNRTQANEWRQIAEELRRRGVLDESEKFFLKSCETNPLDYRTYIGLGKTYLQKGELDKARTFWEKSLPHAPKGEIDYKSYSYRLIGRAYFCEEDYQQAASTLKTSIELSPNYCLGHYDYAQYCALTGGKENCLRSLKIAIPMEPALFELARKERSLRDVRGEIADYVSQESVREEMEFGRVWLKLGVRRSRIDRMIAVLDDLFKEIKTEGVCEGTIRAAIRLTLGVGDLKDAISINLEGPVETYDRIASSHPASSKTEELELTADRIAREGTPWPQLSIPVEMIKRTGEDIFKEKLDWELFWRSSSVRAAIRDVRDIEYSYFRLK